MMLRQAPAEFPGDSLPLPEIEHRQIAANGLDMHVAIAGEGPTVLLCHGFPECWYSWRHQLGALAEAGYRAVAPDMRGYGRTSAPDAIEAYTILHLIGDMTSLLDQLGVRQAVIVGHDWGSLVAWNAALIRPERFRAVCGMSVPFLFRLPMKPTAMMKQLAGDRFVYILYFQQPGVAESELDPQPRLFLRKMLYSISGQVKPEDRYTGDLPKTAKFMDGMTDPSELPAWLSEEDLDVYVAEFERTGFRGGLNWYRNFDRNWELTAAWQGAKVKVPALFIGGLSDPVVTMGGEGEGPAVAALPTQCEDLRAKVLIEGAGHWNQQEKPAETNRALLEFLAGLESA